jgi:hypothetical protein
MSQDNIQEFGFDLENPNAGDETPSNTVFTDLRDALNAPVEQEPLTLAVPLRSSISLQFRRALDYDLLQKIINKNTRKDKINQLQFSYAIIAYMNVGVLLNGAEQTDDENTKFSVRHAEMRNMVNARDVKDCIWKVYGEKAGEGHIIQTAMRIMEECGYGTEIDLDSEDGFNPLEK